MVKLAIRDDDLNYFSKVNDLLEVYKHLQDFPISFAVIPNVTDVSTIGSCPETRGNTEPRWIGDNQELVSWLKMKLKEGNADVLMHGITHGYKFIGDKRYPEMQWRRESNLIEELATQRDRLITMFDYPVTVFVAPSNKISKYALSCVASIGMHYSGIVPANFQRDFTIRNICNYLKRWFYRFKDNMPYPNVMQYSDHREINACLMQGYDYLIRMYQYCEQMNSPMAVNVHYWHLRDNPQALSDLVRFVNYALERGAIPSTMSELLK